MSTSQLFGDSTAVLSGDGLYRYELTRRWDDGPLALWIMLNPSTADARQDDPTIRRCIGYSKREGMGGLAVVNLYALRTTRPIHLAEHHNPVGPENVATLKHWIAHPLCHLVVAAWGAWSHPTLERMDTFVAEYAREWNQPLACLGTTKNGSPRHPLYVKADQPFVAFGVA